MTTNIHRKGDFILAFPLQIDTHLQSRAFYFEMANRFSQFTVSVAKNELNIARWETDGGHISSATERSSDLERLTN